MGTLYVQAWLPGVDGSARTCSFPLWQTPPDVTMNILLGEQPDHIGYSIWVCSTPEDEAISNYEHLANLYNWMAQMESEGWILEFYSV
jgi:hypothetical protein